MLLTPFRFPVARIACAALLVSATGCGEEEKKEPADNPEVSTTLDTAASDTGCTADDTGCLAVVSLLGQANIDTDAGTYDGFDVITFRWLSGFARVGGRSICSVVRKAQVWDEAPVADVNDDGDPIVDGDGAPIKPMTDEQLAECDGCEFAFTVSATEGVMDEYIPWMHGIEVDESENISIVNVVDGELEEDFADRFPTGPVGDLNCETLGAFDDDAMDDIWFGIGFNSTYGSAAPYGAMMYWDRNDEVWKPFGGTAENSPPAFALYDETEGRFLYELLLDYGVLTSE